MNATDRCDRCGAQALVKVMFFPGELFFCGHHFDKHVSHFPENHAVLEDGRKTLVNA